MRLAPALLFLLLTACASSQPDPAQRIIGQWQSTVGGYPVSSVYTDSTVSVDNHQAVPYTLDGSRLIFGNDTVSVRVVSFPSRDEMIQTDPMTGTRHRFVRTGS